ncbi:MAG: isoprenylcysteine carboxylmethyltransferase family protein [Gemmatimonadetes bacterium]|nr:isoprenylcysteine carboxylmethyltransferase family protein [Gemmatimonadota bacterium]
MRQLPLSLRALLATAIPVTVAGVVPWLMLGGALPRVPAWRYGLLVPMLGGLALALWGIVLFATRGRGTLAPVSPPTQFVACGPYRFTRNPMYVGVTCWLLGLAMFTGARALLWYAVLVPVGFHMFVRFVEEPKLRRRFGAEYEAYTQRVPRWLGRRRGTREA